MHGKTWPNTTEVNKCVSCVKSVKPNRGCICGILIHRIFFLVVVECPGMLRTPARIHIPKHIFHSRDFSSLLSSAQKASESQCTSPLPEKAACRRNRMEAQARKINSPNQLIQTEPSRLNNSRIRTVNDKSEDGRLVGRYVYALCS